MVQRLSDAQLEEKLRDERKQALRMMLQGKSTNERREGETKLQSIRRLRKVLLRLSCERKERR